MNALGNHILFEFMRCELKIMNEVSRIEREMAEVARKAGATVINSTFHHVSPYGVSDVVVIEESHPAIHTWPEYGYASVDLFTCGEMDAWISLDYLKECFKSVSYPELNKFGVNPDLKSRLIVLLKRVGRYKSYKALSTKLRK